MAQGHRVDDDSEELTDNQERSLVLGVSCSTGRTSTMARYICIESIRKRSNLSDL
jgi:hypothetical protein